jgi:hypothetical protein
MTTISSTSSTLSSLAALYAQEDGASTTGSDPSTTGSGATTAGLTSDQVASLVGTAENGAPGGANSLFTLLG